MPESPKVRFTRPRAASVTGDRTRLTGSQDPARTRREPLTSGDRPPPRHRLRLRRAKHISKKGPADALCSCGWHRFNVTVEQGKAASREHKEDMKRKEK